MNCSVGDRNDARYLISDGPQTGTLQIWDADRLTDSEMTTDGEVLIATRSYVIIYRYY